MGGVTPEEFYALVLAHADADRRLSVPDQAGWEIFPFEPGTLVVKPLDPPVLPEPPRNGEGSGPCWRCGDPDSGVVWSDERWVLSRMSQPPGIPFMAMLMPKAHLDLEDLDETHAAEFGQLQVKLARAAAALPSVGRVHLNKWGDGAAHLHLFILGRPAGLRQLRGSNLALWDDLLPPLPEDIYTDNLRQVVDTLQ